MTERQPGRRTACARVAPGGRAGTVTVDLAPASDGAGGSEVQVTCQLTALSDRAGAELAELAAGYAGFLRSGQDGIAALPGR